MPTISYSLEELIKGLNRSFTNEELNELLEMCKCELKQIKGDEIIGEITPERPDLFSTEGLIHFIKGILSIEKGPKRLVFIKENFKVKISERLKQVRPYVVIATVRGVKLTNEALRRIINYQEILHESWCRSRKKASIGIYDLSKLKGDIYFELKNLDEIYFRPLEESKKMTGREIIERNEKGIKYRHLIMPNDAPVLIDSEGNYLSMAPIINSEDCKVNEKTTDILIDSTGFDIDFINSIVALMVHSITYYGGKVGIVRHELGIKIYYPNFSSKFYEFNINDFSKVIGVDFSSDQLINFLERLRYGVNREAEKLIVEVPFYRVDVLHPIDVIEDVAILYGYNNFKLSLPYLITKPKLSKKSIIHNSVREIFNGFGFQEILNYMLCDVEVQTFKVNINESTIGLIKILNPISKEFSCIRANLFPCLLSFLSRNIANPYPQKIYEIGDVIINTGSQIKTINKLAGAVVDNEVEFEDIHGYLYAFFDSFNYTLSLQEAKLPYGLNGRSALLKINNKNVGWVAEINPDVLLKFSIRMPTIMFEIDLSEVFNL